MFSLAQLLSAAHLYERVLVVSEDEGPTGELLVLKANKALRPL